MSVNPILDASNAIIVHTLTASFALILGPFVFTPKRRGKLHKTLGYCWITSLCVAACSSFFVHEIRLAGPFSPIHILSVVTLIGLARGLLYIRQGNVKAHQRTMLSLYWLGVLAAGIFTMLPGRIMNDVLFPNAPWMGYVVIALGSILITRFILRQSSTAAGPA
jgi:uncharacterized membrane protein